MVDDQQGQPDSVTFEGDFVYRRVSHECNYAVGTDPVWGLTSNKLTFTNGMKMKLSVIFGILHMTIGIIIKGFNTIYFKDYASFVLEVVTGLIILLGLFGWMDLLVFAKWFHTIDIENNTPYKDKTTPVETDSTDPGESTIPVSIGDWQNRHAPSVINLMIDGVFNFGKPKDETMDPYLGNDLNGQFKIGFVLLILVVIMVPIMLCVKPCFFRGGSSADDDDNEIEFTNIQRADNDLNQGLVQPAIQRQSRDASDGADDVMQKR